MCNPQANEENMDKELKIAYLSHLDAEVKHYRDRNTKVAFSYVALGALAFLAYGKGDIPNNVVTLVVLELFFLIMLVLVPIYISKTANKSRKVKGIRSIFIKENYSDQYEVNITDEKNVFSELASGGINSFLIMCCGSITLFLLVFNGIKIFEIYSS